MILQRQEMSWRRQRREEDVPIRSILGAFYGSRRSSGAIGPEIIRKSKDMSAKVKGVRTARTHRKENIEV
jgi:hypothetical protein